MADYLFAFWFVCFFGDKSYYVDQAILNTQRSFCLCPLNAGIKGAAHLSVACIVCLFGGTFIVFFLSSTRLTVLSQMTFLSMK